jgi:hypothetical protein
MRSGSRPLAASGMVCAVEIGEDGEDAVVALGTGGRAATTAAVDTQRVGESGCGNLEGC